MSHPLAAGFFLQMNSIAGGIGRRGTYGKTWKAKGKSMGEYVLLACGLREIRSGEDRWKSR
jgi:hypothetical protein